jgi:diadenosine tetraphosphatase ApaH/serine/threonine PP2A family protein phosphatase
LNTEPSGYGLDDPDAAPIFDDRIVGWLEDPVGVPLEKNSTVSYGEYLDLLASWGESYGRTRAQVETEIFRLATDADESSEYARRPVKQPRLPARRIPQRTHLCSFYIEVWPF